MQALRKLAHPIPPRDSRPEPPAVRPATTASAGPAPVNTSVQVIYGASVQNLPLGGMTVSQARELASALLQVAPRTPFLLNGRPAGASTVIRPGDLLEFVHHAGEKGAAGGPPDRDRGR
jgi:hypothetical protein